MFGETDDFQNALRNEGNLSLYMTGYGRFRARLTRVALHHMRLEAGAEQLPRIGFMAVPSDMVLVTFSIGDQPSPIWGGIRPRRGDLMTFGPDHRFHMRTQGPCRWGAIWIPRQVFAEASYELMGKPLSISPIAELWRPSHVPGGLLLRLHGAAIRAAEVRPETIVDPEAAHGMEQQLIHALVECLSAKPVTEQTQSTPEHQKIAADFEALLQTRRGPEPRSDKRLSSPGLPSRCLRKACDEVLGRTPESYMRLRALHLVHDILRNETPGTMSVIQLASQYGFHAPGRFAAHYRALFGELPSVTLARPPPVIGLCSLRATALLAETVQNVGVHAALRNGRRAQRTATA
jgi:AraC-like DNA-binding protein